MSNEEDWYIEYQSDDTVDLKALKRKGSLSGPHIVQCWNEDKSKQVLSDLELIWYRKFYDIAIADAALLARLIYNLPL
jgi:hypothetical protein